MNTQNVQGTLMALCDDPATTSVGQQWAATKPLPRVPIYVTANDLSCLYAPLVREGRMEKFFFQPTRDETAELLARLFGPGLGPGGAASLLSAFPSQPLDFFAAIKSRLVDHEVSAWIRATGVGAMGVALLGEEAEYANDPISTWSSRKRVTIADPSDGSAGDARTSSSELLESAVQAGLELAREQQLVLDINLVREYMPGVAETDGGQPNTAGRRGAHSRRDIGWRRGTEGRLPPPPPTQPVPSIMSEELRSYWEHLASNTVVSSKEEPVASVSGSGESDGASPRHSSAAEVAAANAAASSASELRGWPVLSPDQVHTAMHDGSASVLDVRSIREWDWGKIKGATHCPIVLATGSSMSPGTRPNPDFLKLVAAKFPVKARPLVVYGSTVAVDAAGGAPAVAAKGVFVSKALSLSGGEDFVAAAVEALRAAGYEDVSELGGRYGAWDLAYRPDGRRREKGKWADKSSGELEWWTASN